MPPNPTCKQLAAGIRLLKTDHIPADERRLAQAKNLLQQATDDGVTGPDLDRFNAMVFDAENALQEDQRRLRDFEADYEIKECPPPEFL